MSTDPPRFRSPFSDDQGWDADIRWSHQRRDLVDNHRLFYEESLKACVGPLLRGTAEEERDDKTEALLGYAIEQAKTWEALDAMLPEEEDESTSSALLNAPPVVAAVAAAKGSMGQTVVQDLLISFEAPRSLMQKRDRILLPRSAAEGMSTSHGDLLQRAHKLSMLGAEVLWEDESAELVRICVLLSGLAMLYAKDTNSVRNDRPFSGRVVLPFITNDTFFLTAKGARREQQSDTRLDIVLAAGEFFAVRVESGTPRRAVAVKARGKGLEGLCRCIVTAFSDK